MRSMLCSGLGVLTTLLLATFYLCGSSPTQKKDSQKMDYSKELPRVPPTSKEKALGTFQMIPGFELQIVASEPLIRDPVAMAFDENGFLYVAEYPEYNQIDNPKFKERGSIKRLEDTDGDGTFDKATTFITLDSPVALGCYDGGLFVGAVPNLLFCKDTDGDGKADIKEVIYTGFGRDRAGEGMLNSFRWGLDNRFHVSTSLAGGTVKRVSGKKSVSIRRQGFIFDPRTLGFELDTGGGQHGMSLDDWGRRFVCTNSTPMQMLMYEGKYVRRNQFLRTPNPAVNINREGRYNKLFRLSPNEPWRVVRTRLRKKGVVRGPIEAGKPSGYFTGATGITVYRGAAWPKEFRGNVFVGDVSNNLVYRGKVVPRGVSLVVKRADKEQEFLASKDIWFRPAQLAHGPDGNLYVIDMYRELIETVVSIPPFITKHLDPTSGVDRGRIYRIVRKGYEHRSSPKLGSMSAKKLVAYLEDPNGWHRDTASRLIYERQDRRTIPVLKELAISSKSPQGRVHGLWSLDGLQALTTKLVVRGMMDEHPRVREQAIRLAEKFSEDAEVQAELVKLVGDPDARVRYQLAFSLGEFRTQRTLGALHELTRKDGDDPWMRLAINSSVGWKQGEFLHRLAKDRTLRKSQGVKLLLMSLARQVGAANRSHELAALVKTLEDITDRSLAKALLTECLRNLPAKSRQKFTKQGQTDRVLREMLRVARIVATDTGEKLEKRVDGIRTLGFGKYEAFTKLAPDLLAVSEPVEIQRATLQTLARYSQPEVAEVIVKTWRSMSPSVRASAAETMFTRGTWTSKLLDAIENGTVKPTEIDPARINLLKAAADRGLRMRANKLFGTTTLSKRKDVLQRYRTALSLPGSAARGKLVFQKTCSACHMLENVGKAVGADLSAIKDRGNETILLNILDPNREVKPQYVAYVLVTKAGRTLSGMIANETTNSITIRKPDGSTETILRTRIKGLRSSGLSYMPEGLEKQVSVEEMADLLAYLNGVP
ncbi:MAG: PVC-type heme-binding CxxCH protein [Gemmataceae bacterium]